MLKQEILLENGTFNKNHVRVTDQRFLSDNFYDPQDLVQVKYEMLRTARESGSIVDEIAGQFGFSRSAYYKIKESFEKEGISAFVPNKSGPKKARKLTGEHQKFIDSCLKMNPGISSNNITQMLKKERGLVISKRTVERYRNRQSRQDR